MPSSRGSSPGIKLTSSASPTLQADSLLLSHIYVFMYASYLTSLCYFFICKTAPMIVPTS